MHRNRSAQQNLVADLRAAGMNIHTFRNDADPGGADENFVGFAAINHFCVAGHELHARCIRCFAHRLHNAPKVFHRQTFLQNESGGEMQRSGPAHREIVDRAVDR